VASQNNAREKSRVRREGEMITTLLIIHGLMAVALLGALTHQTLLLVSAIALALPRQPTMRIWSGIVWLVPIGGIIFFFYLLQGYFLR
jgi:hypothetical protein